MKVKCASRRWLRCRGSNSNYGNQNPRCYHYTTSQCAVFPRCQPRRELALICLAGWPVFGHWGGRIQRTPSDQAVLHRPIRDLFQFGLRAGKPALSPAPGCRTPEGGQAIRDFSQPKQIHGDSHPAHSLYGHIVVEHNSPKKRPGEPHRPGQVQANGESYCAKRTDEKVCGSRAITAVIS